MLGPWSALLSLAALAGCTETGTPDDGSAGAGTGGSTGGVGTGGTGGSGAVAGSSGGVAGSPVGTGGSGGSGGASGGTGSGATGGSTGGVGPAGSGGVTGGAGATGTGATGAGGTGAGGATGAAGATGSSGAGGRVGAGGMGSGGMSAGAGGRGGAGGSGGGATTCPAATPLTGGTQYCSNSKGGAGGNYRYELWAEGGGSGCMRVYGKGAAFNANWSNVGDFLARVGLDFDQTKTHSQIGTISADFQETQTNLTGLVYIGIYGWTVNPLKEYYILDDWGPTKPAGTASDGTPRERVGTMEIDGDTYDVWKKERVNKPSIIGDQTFYQYFSIRTNARQCGHISISEHFKGWEKLGLDLGKLYEAKMLVESQDSSGTVDFTKVTVQVE